MSIKVIKEILYENFSTHFEYDEESPSGLVRKATKNNLLKAGKPCGTISKDGYWFLSHKGASYQVARVIYCLVYGKVDSSKVVDHIDQNKRNNKIVNLRLVTIKENNRNKPKYRTNKTGATGATGVTYLEIFNRVDKCNRYYRAIINNDAGKATVKSFNIEKYGEALAFELACNFREETLKNRDHYTERHGK